MLFASGVSRRVEQRLLRGFQTQVRGLHTPMPMTPKIDLFRQHVRDFLPSNGERVAFATAWLATDNVFVHLMHQHFPQTLDGLSLVAVDTLHLFDETYKVADAVQNKYEKQSKIYLPLEVTNREEFIAKYGECETMDHAHFDFVSKVEPFQRALSECNKDILITGRRMDQGNERISLDVFEDKKRIFNPLAEWSWSDITTFCDMEGVPVNPAHNYVFRCDAAIPPTRRHLPDDVLGWTRLDLGKPFWQLSDHELRGDSTVHYVFKSFGDLHTSVPVKPDESERAGRFVRYGNTECGIHTRTTSRGAPHGGELVDRYVADDKQRQILVDKCVQTIDLTERHACDVLLLSTGGFSPLNGFMTEDIYNHVVDNVRTPELVLFGLPVTFDVPTDDYAIGDHILLRYNDIDLAVLDVQSVFTPDKIHEARLCYGTTSVAHPSVHSLLHDTHAHYVGGPIHALVDNFSSIYHNGHFKTPKEVRAELPTNKPVIAFQNRNPIHKAHFELLVRAHEDIEDSLILVHPTCGPTQPGDISHEARIRTYEQLQQDPEYSRWASDFVWAYLPYSMKMAGPREAVQHMLIRKNFGATHFIIGRDMAGTKNTITGEDFYGPYDAQQLGMEVSTELGMEVLTYENMVYVGEEVGNVRGYTTEGNARAQHLKITKLSGTEFRRMLRSGEDIPSWFAFDSVVEVLREGGEEIFL
eukprot:GEMP01015611.1.p1 GENE.GEMP01015611.1~~GEMP01015611.1.p1  ORF type:complete len:724 (+),score=183.69 GEMP01015611.1:83-2173(+)